VSRAGFDHLLSKDIEPLFWTPERLNRASAWWGHVPFAFWLTAACKPRLLVELGTHLGVSYAAFCEAVVRSRLETRCFAVDTWGGDAHAGFYGDDVYDDFKDFHDKRYASFSELLRKTFDEACSCFGDGTIDLLHIDGFHTYEAVRHDFETWRPKLSKQAIVLLHDTNEWRDDFGVGQFFGELKKELPVFEFLHCHGLGVVAVGAEMPMPVRELCAFTKDSDIAAVRNRFAYFGARWMATSEAEPNPEPSLTRVILSRMKGKLSQLLMS
jgi:O-antigen biosynthesis protein